jgi:hypothetical protein
VPAEKIIDTAEADLDAKPLGTVAFLNRILASKGFRCGTIINNKHARQSFFRTNEEARRMALLEHEPGRCLSLHATFPAAGSRKKNEGSLYKAVWVDCDLKFDAALAASAAFFKSSGVPLPSIYISSGGGFHLYWVFTRDITLNEWERAATLLRRACEVHHFEIDGKCTINFKN